MQIDWDLIDKTSMIAGIVGTFASAIAAYIAFAIRSAQKRIALESARKAENISTAEGAIAAGEEIQSPKPCALAISLLPASGTIKPDVEQFLLGRKDKRFHSIPIMEIDIDGVAREKLPEFLKQLHAKRREIEANGFTEVHLFLAGPVVSGLLIGAIFDNWKPVKIYHKNQQTKMYEYFSLLVK